MMISGKEEQKTLIDFAEKIGQLSQGFENLKTNFDNHLKEHSTDRVMQWVIIGLQTVVLVLLGWLKYTGKI